MLTNSQHTGRQTGPFQHLFRLFSFFRLVSPDRFRQTDAAAAYSKLNQWGRRVLQPTN